MKLRWIMTLALAVLLAACAETPTQPTATTTHDIVAAIQAAGNSDQSALTVTPLRDPALQLLLQQAQSEIVKRDFAAAANVLDRAHARAPSDPEVVQRQAELAVRQHHYADAERLARQSFALGPKLGSLCARNWQTVVEMRDLAHDAAGVASARKGLDACHVDPIKRM